MFAVGFHWMKPLSDADRKKKSQYQQYKWDITSFLTKFIYTIEDSLTYCITLDMICEDI